MLARSLLNEMFEGNLEMVRKGKIEELPSGSESEGEEEEAVILLRYSCNSITFYYVIAVVVPCIPPVECLFRSYLPCW